MKKLLEKCKNAQKILKMILKLKFTLKINQALYKIYKQLQTLINSLKKYSQKLKFQDMKIQMMRKKKQKMMKKKTKVTTDINHSNLKKKKFILFRIV